MSKQHFDSFIGASILFGLIEYFDSLFIFQLGKIMSQLRRVLLLLILSLSYVFADSTLYYRGYSVRDDIVLHQPHSHISHIVCVELYCQFGIKCSKLLELCSSSIIRRWYVELQLAAMARNCICRRLQYHTIVCCSCSTNSVRRRFHRNLSSIGDVLGSMNHRRSFGHLLYE